MNTVKGNTTMISERTKQLLEKAQCVINKTKMPFKLALLCMIIEDNSSEAYKLLLESGLDMKKYIPVKRVNLTESPRFLCDEYRNVVDELNNKEENSVLNSKELLKFIIEDKECIQVMETTNINVIQLKYLTVTNDKNDLSSSYSTPSLDTFTTDMVELDKQGLLDPVINRDKEIERVIHILSRRMKNNPLVVGEPGVGKTAIVEGICQRINSGNVPKGLKNKRILSLDLTSMIAGSRFRGDFEERMQAVVTEATNNEDVILFVDEIHRIIGAGDHSGSSDAANILKPALARGEFQMIGATTTKEKMKFFEKDGALERRFQSVLIEPPDEEHTIRILQGIKHKYEAYHQVEISGSVLDFCVKQANRYISDRFFPDKAIDVMDEACASKKLREFIKPELILNLEDKIEKMKVIRDRSIRGNKLITAGKTNKEVRKLEDTLKTETMSWISSEGMKLPVVSVTDVARCVSRITGIDVEEVSKSETGRLKNLESKLHEKIISQDEAIEEVCKSIRRARVGLRKHDKPIANFMFVGPTGVGKTELCKVVSSILFGTKKSLKIIDMSEYSEKFNVSSLIGSPPGYIGYDEGGELTNAVRKNPYCLVLFDEIEKAHPDIYDILLQIMDNGRLSDKLGHTVDFKNTIIVMTSNIGAKNINQDKNKLGFINKEITHKEMEGDVRKEIKDHFKPEFLNRIDNIIVFKKLTKDNLIKICAIMIKEVEQEASERNIKIEIDDKAKELIVTKSMKEDQPNARPLRRMIQKMVEDKLTNMILDEELTGSQLVKISKEKEELKFTVEECH